MVANDLEECLQKMRSYYKNKKPDEVDVESLYASLNIPDGSILTSEERQAFNNKIKEYARRFIDGLEEYANVVKVIMN